MSYTLTYQTLKEQVMSYVDDDVDEFQAELENIVVRGHDQVQRDLSLAMWRTFEVNTIRAGIKAYDRKIGWLKVLSVFLPASGGFVEKRSLDYCRMYRGAGTPKFYCEVSQDALQFAPTPNDNITAEIEVLTRLPALSAANPTSWITNNCADLLLLQCLIQAELFLVAPERMQEFAGLYGQLLSSIRTELRGTDRDEATPMRQAPGPGVTA